MGMGGNGNVESHSRTSLVDSDIRHDKPQLTMFHFQVASFFIGARPTFPS